MILNDKVEEIAQQHIALIFRDAIYSSRETVVDEN